MNYISATDTINSQDIRGRTPLHLAVNTYSRYESKRLDTVKALCENGEDASLRDKRGQILELTWGPSLSTIELTLSCPDCYFGWFITCIAAWLWGKICYGLQKLKFYIVIKGEILDNCARSYFLGKRELRITPHRSNYLQCWDMRLEINFEYHCSVLGFVVFCDKVQHN